MNDIDWYNIFWIDQSEIKNGLSIAIDFNNFNNVVDGDWDLHQNKFEDFAVFDQTKDLLNNNNCKNIYSDRYESEKNVRINNLITFYNDIKENGFKCQKTLFYEKTYIYNPDGKFGDEITVAIDRDGHLVLINGWHRLSIARMLKVDKIPIRVGLRHKLWHNYCEKVKEFINIEWKSDGRGQIYQPIQHIDFYNLTSIWTSYRYDVIKKNMSLNSGKLLDIGSLFGYFCHKFESDGFDCTAVEIQKSYFEYLNKFKLASYKNFNVINDSIFNLKDFNFDVILGLNIFHHFLKTEKYFRLFENFLIKLKVKEFFVQTHEYNDGQMNGSFINFSPIEFVEFIMKKTNLSNYKQIGLENNRDIFKIW